MSLTDSQNSCIVINTNHHGHACRSRRWKKQFSRHEQKITLESHVTIQFLLLKIEASAKRKK